MSASIKMHLRNLQLLGRSSLILEEMFNVTRFYSTKSNPAPDLRKLRPMILKRIEERANEYPVKGMLPVAREVLQARTALYDGVSTLIQHIPIWACKFAQIPYPFVYFYGFSFMFANPSFSCICLWKFVELS